jgi:hypothetical protein
MLSSAAWALLFDNLFESESFGGETNDSAAFDREIRPARDVAALFKVAESQGRVTLRDSGPP